MSSWADPKPPAPPHAAEAEKALLGAILLNGGALDGVRHIVTPSDFFEEVHGFLFETMCRRRDAGEAIDLTLIKTAIGDQDLGGLTVGQYLARMVAEATTVVLAPDYARSVREAAQMRRVFETAQAASAAMTGGAVADPAAYAAQMIEALDEIASSRLSEHLRRISIGESAARVLRRVREAQAGRVRHGVPFGIPSLDHKTLGMRSDQLIILAGRPGMGKTTAAIHFSIAAARHGHGVGFVSLEMNADELSERALAAIAYDPRANDVITYRAITQGSDISEAAYARLDRARVFCDALPLEIEQQPGLTVSQISARARQMRLRFERVGQSLGLLVIDHIGLIRPSKRYSGNRVQEMTEISGSLKELAKELGIPVLALSQLNRGLEGRPDKRPILSDLRDSGSIEQDADVVLSLFREAYYLEHIADPKPEELDRLARAINTLEIEILKQRGGPTARIECFCDVACNVLAESA